METNQRKIEFGTNKAIQSIMLEINEDGTAKLGVTVWVPTGSNPAYRAVVCAIDITDDQRHAIVVAFKREQHEAQKQSR